MATIFFEEKQDFLNIMQTITSQCNQMQQLQIKLQLIMRVMYSDFNMTMHEGICSDLRTEVVS